MGLGRAGRGRCVRWSFRALVGVAVAVAAALASGPSAGATILVRAGGDLQAALSQAHGGDVILLEAGATFVGNFVLPARRDEGQVTIRTASSDQRLPGEMTRVSPAMAGLLPTLRTPNAEPAVSTAPGARGWRLELIEIAGNPGAAGELVRLGDGGDAQSSVARVPGDLVIDRCYIHGDPAAGQKRGIALNSGRTTIQNSWIADIKARGQDSQAIAGWNGPGPYELFNNHLEAAGQALMLGGADPSIPGLVPAAIRVVGNHLTRPLSWRGGPWQVKNLLELKNARGVSIQGNLFEHNWQAAQAGYAVLFTPRNQGGRAPWSTVEDVRFRDNVVRHVSAGVSVLGHDSPNLSGTAQGIEVSDNLFSDLDGRDWGGNGEFLLVGDGPSDLVFERNTILQSGNILSVYGGSADRPAAVRGFVFRDNLVRHNAYGVHGNDRGVGSDTLDAYFPGSAFAGNVIGGGSARQYPADNRFLSAAAFDRLFADLAAGDFRLTSAARGGSGRAAGANIDRVDRACRAAEQGTWLNWPLLDEERDRPRPGRGRGE
jgi:hypothetical protein